jgi:hypothetical protein
MAADERIHTKYMCIPTLNFTDSVTKLSSFRCHLYTKLDLLQDDVLNIVFAEPG